MIIASCVIGACLTCAVSLATEKLVSKGWEILEKKKHSPEDLERIARIQQIYSSIEEIAKDDPSQKGVVKLIKVSMINDIEKKSVDDLKEIERVISGILLGYHGKMSMVAA